MSAAEPSETTGDELKARSDAARAGGSAKYAEKLRQEHKLPVRRRLELLLDPDFLIEDGLLAHSEEAGYGADGVVTVIGRIDGRTVCVMANDPTVKAGSWGPRTVEKIVRIQETAERLRVPIFYLVDSAGARITDQVQMFPGRRHAGRIFYQEVRLSGVVPQICLLFGPSAAGGAPGNARPRGRGASVQHAATDRWGDRRRLFLRNQAPLREGDHLRPRPHRGSRSRRRRQPADAQGWHPVCRFRRQGGPLHLALRRVQHPTALSRRRPRLHDRYRRRAAGDHPPRREDD